jgi:hypothetical protein
MDATLYTGNGSTNTIVNTDNATQGFKPDLVWMKSRGNNYDNTLYDSVRGTGTGAELSSNQTGAEGLNSTLCNLTSFNSNGFSLGTTSSTNIINNSGGSFVAWQWQAGQGTTSSNTNGSITSTVSVNATAGFSIVTYTGNGASSATAGHGLGVAPSMVITKGRTNAYGWGVQHIGLTGGNNYLALNTTAAQATDNTQGTITNATSSIFQVSGSGGASSWTNLSGVNYVAYCWAQVAGFSQFGSYTGNGSSDGPFIYCGFRPKYVMFKCTSNTSHWTVYDTSRDVYNAAYLELSPDTANAENTTVTGDAYDLLSNGFKCRASVANEENVNGYTYIYAAFAENPFKYANAR